MRNIVTASINVHNPEYTVKVAIAFTNEWAIKSFTEEYLEANKIFLFGFDFTPLEHLEGMEDWGEVVKEFPNSDRVLDKKYWLGNHTDKLNAMDSYIQANIGSCKYEIVARERGSKWL